MGQANGEVNGSCINIFRTEGLVQSLNALVPDKLIMRACFLSNNPHDISTDKIYIIISVRMSVLLYDTNFQTS
jgi:hypothetical protein